MFKTKMIHLEKELAFWKSCKRIKLHSLLWLIETDTFKGVSQFKYLGRLITNKNKLKVEIGNRILMANGCYFGLKNQLKSKFISRRTKVSLYKTLIRPIILYGNKIWVLNKAEGNRLLAFERKILRSIFGAVKENNAWRSLYNIL